MQDDLIIGNQLHSINQSTNQAYLPAQMSDEELRQKIDESIEQTGASSIKDMGKVMGAATSKLAGKADNKRIAGIVRERLGY